MEKVSNKIERTKFESFLVEQLFNPLLCLQHGFSEDNLKELQYAVHQMQREGEKTNERYVKIIDQIFREFFDKAKTGLIEVDPEVSQCAGMDENCDVIIDCRFVALWCVVGDTECHAEMVSADSQGAFFKVSTMLQKIHPCYVIITMTSVVL